MGLVIAPIANSESGGSVRAKLNTLLLAVSTGSLFTDSDYAADVAAIIAQVVAAVSAAEANANNAKEDALEAHEKANAVEAEVESLVSGTLATILADLVDKQTSIDGITSALIALNDVLAGLDQAVLDNLEAMMAEIEGLGLGSINARLDAALRLGGWANDPTFSVWSGADLARWETVGVTTYAEQDQGRFGSALGMDIPSGNSQLWVRAASDAPGQLTGANPALEYVAVTIELVLISGVLGGSQLRPQWKAAGASQWTNGHGLGGNNRTGILTNHWGFTNTPGRVQQRTAIWQRPVGANADAVGVVFFGKITTSSGAVAMRVDHINIRAATDAEIAAFNAATRAELDSMEASITGPGGAIATAVNNYKATVDANFSVINMNILAATDSLSALTGVVTTQGTSFGNSIALLTSGQQTLSNNAGALSGRVERMEAQTGGSNYVKNPIFARDGAAVLTPGAVPVDWKTWPSGFQVIARNPGSPTAAINSAPTQYIVQVAGDGAQYEATAFDMREVSPGDRLRPNIWVAGAGSGTKTLEMRVIWRDAEGQPLTAGATAVRPVTFTGNAWQQPSDWGNFLAPANARYFSLAVRRVAGATGNPVYFTLVECLPVDNVSHAVATSAMGVATTAESSIAQMQTTIGATFGTLAAFVTQTASAIAQVNKAQSTIVFRATAGGGAAGLRLVAYDDVNGIGSEIMFDARYIVAPGTVTMGELVVMDHGYNMEPDAELQSPTAWTFFEPKASRWQILGVSSASDQNSLGELRWTYESGGSGEAVAWGPEFSVVPGDELTVGFQVRGMAADGIVYTAASGLRFTEKNGSNTVYVQAASVTASSTVLQTRSAKITVPSGMRRARRRFSVNLNVTNATVRFSSPTVVRQSDASVLIRPDGAFISNLQTWNAWILSAMIGTAQIGAAHIAQLSVGKLHIIDGDVGRLYSANNSTSANVGNPNEQTIVTLTIPAGVSGRALAILSTAYRPTGTDDLSVTHRVRQNGTLRFQRVLEYGGSTDWKMPTWPVGLTVAAGDVITFSLHRTSGSGSGQIGHRFTDLGVFVSQR